MTGGRWPVSGWSRPGRIAKGVAELRHVGAADAAEGDLDLDHPRAERQRQLDVLEPQVTRGVPAHGLHPANLAL